MQVFALTPLDCTQSICIINAHSGVTVCAFLLPCPLSPSTLCCCHLVYVRAISVLKKTGGITKKVALKRVVVSCLWSQSGTTYNVSDTHGGSCPIKSLVCSATSRPILLL